MSDLHLELDRKTGPLDIFRISQPDVPVASRCGPSVENLLGTVDLVLLAGDIDVKTKGIGYAYVLAGYVGVPIVYVAGNHEFYGGQVALVDELAKVAAGGEGVYFLENRRMDLEVGAAHVVVLGATLWTDFELHGEARRKQSMEAGAAQMTDYHVIRANPPLRMLLPADTMALHDQSRAWLESELASLEPGTISIVLTHHAPSALSLPDGERNDPLAAAYASNLEELIARLRPTVWVHGHTHHAADYRLHATRVLSHPFGYPHERKVREALVVQV
jgi:predicted phosphodiesterase